VTQVWGALLASTLTTVAIFLPILFLKDESGQLFADLALAISVSVFASLLVALTIIPTAARHWLPAQVHQDPHRHWWQAATDQIMRLTDNPVRRTVLIAGLISLPLLVTLALLPKADYLPEGNRNLVFAFILPPPGMNIDHLEREMGTVVAERLQPYLDGEQQPRIDHYFFVAFSGGVFLGARAQDAARVGELVPVINAAIRGFPDTLGFARRVSLFGRFGAGRSIDMNLQSRNVDALYQAARSGFAKVKEVLPGANIRPLPGLEQAEPELRLRPNEARIAEAGWTRNILAQLTQTFGEGLQVGEHFDGERRLDVVARVEPWQTPEDLAAIPLATPNAGVLPVAALLHIERTAGPNEIRRLDRRRTVTLQITPPQGISLEEAVELLQQRVEPELLSMLPEDGEIRYAGTADKLQQALQSMGGSFALAVIILYLLMSALFRSFLDSLLVLLALPLATVGGVLGLRLTNLLVFQPLDLLTMIGFIILMGLVVNNAILLVHQTRSAERNGLLRRAAVAQAVRLRLRPILMSTLTSLFGMLPLLLIPGPGSELYRGLAAVIVGGMALSTLFTLLLLPSLLRIGESTGLRAEPDTIRQ
jgi:multidrug efflux pump subunit AcrB